MPSRIKRQASLTEFNRAKLVAFMRRLAREPFTWGETDCALCLADWWQINHGVDPAAHLRGTYSTEAECAAYLAGDGGLPRVVARLARAVGAVRTVAPQPGDFAVIRIERAWFGGILTPRGLWAIKSSRGLLAIRCAPVAAWQI